MSSSFRRSGKKTLSSSRSTSTHTRTRNTGAVSTSAGTVQRQTQSTPSSSSFPPTHTSTHTPTHTPTTAVLERIGTKPWVGGLTLTSSGLRELDAIYGGGQPLGTAILIEEDRWTQDLALSLVRYWAAEGVAQGQCLSLVSSVQDVRDMDLSALDSISATATTTSSSSTIQFQQGMSAMALQEFAQRMLPRNLHYDKAKAKSDALTKQMEQVAQAQADGVLPLPTLGEFGTIEEHDDDDDFDEAEMVEMERAGKFKSTSTSSTEDEGLTNAWQYKVSVQKERNAVAHASPAPRGLGARYSDGVYCHSYDLSGKLQDQHSPTWQHENHISIVNCIHPNPSTSTSSIPFSSNHTSTFTSAIYFYRTCIRHIQDKISTTPHTVIRMLIMNAHVEQMAIVLPLLLNYIRSHSLPVALLLTVRPWLGMARTSKSTSTSQHNDTYSQSLIALKRSSDAILSCEGFNAMRNAPPSEFSDLAGILTIQKMALYSMSHFSDSSSARRPPANRYGMKRDRRKMHIRMLHLPPEDFSAGNDGDSGGGNGNGGNRTGARSGGGSSSTGGGQKTALQPGLACATSMKSNASSSSSTSLEF